MVRSQAELNSCFRLSVKMVSNPKVCDFRIRRVGLLLSNFLSSLMIRKK